MFPGDELDDEQVGQGGPVPESSRHGLTCQDCAVREQAAKSTTKQGAHEYPGRCAVVDGHFGWILVSMVVL